MTQARLLAFLLGGSLSLLSASPAPAAKLVDGSFLAVEDCPAYVSKAEQTNPDNTRLVPGRIYPVFEVNFADASDAYRIRIESADPKERWVAAECGEYPPKSSPAEIRARHPVAESATAAAAVPMESACPAPPQEEPPPPEDAQGKSKGKKAKAKTQSKVNACRTCGQPDAWVLVLNWQPGVCQAGGKTSADRPECRTTDPGLYQARNFTLRELRPVRNACKGELAFCGAVDREPKRPADYPPLELADATRRSLAQFMPGTADDSGAERHAWHKYGACTGFPRDGYFELATDLVQQFNQSGMAGFMAENLGKKVRREEFFKHIEAALGNGARTHINIECGPDAKLLTGVVINLGAGALPGADLKALIQQGAKAGAPGNCASRFVVDEIGLE